MKRKLSPIERRALDLIQRHNLSGPPFDVQQLAQELGIKVTKSDLGEDCSGVLVKRGNSAVVAVNWEHHPNRQRFSIAHEIGHFVLHKNGTYVDRSTSAFFRNAESGSGSVKEEREANSFAAALLMPAASIDRAVSESSLNLDDEDAVLDLAEQFEVSAQAMSFRLANLGLTTLES